MMHACTATMARRVVTSTLRSPVFFRPASYFSTDKNVQLVINAVGIDRPAIVSDFAKHVVEAGGNVGESKASIMGSHLFSVMMMVQVPSSKHAALTEALQTIDGMNTSVFETDIQVERVSSPVGYHWACNVEWSQPPWYCTQGHFLCWQGLGVNIDSLETAEEPAPHGGTTLFLMNGLVSVPAPLSKDFDAKKIREQLEELGDDLNCDIGLEDVHEETDPCAVSVA